MEDRDYLTLAEITDKYDRERLSRLQRQHLQFLIDAIGSSRRSLRPGEVRAKIRPLGSLGANRRVASVGTSGERYAPDFGVVDQNVVLLDISDSIVTSRNAVFLDNIILTSELGLASPLWRMSGYFQPLEYGLGITTYDPDAQECICQIADPVPLRDQRGYFLFKSGAAFLNFGHFVQDLLLQVPFYDWACEMAGSELIPIIVNSARHRNNNGLFAYEIIKLVFESLVCSGTDVEFLDGRDVAVGKCFTTSATFSTPDFSVSKFASGKIRCRILSEIVPLAKVDGLGKKIWISRGDGITNRQAQYLSGITNGDVVDEIARESGYHVANLSKYNAVGILGLMSGAEVLAGLHGAGLYNSIFCPAGARMVEATVAPWTFEGAWLMSEAFGIRTERVPVIPDEGGSNYRIDIERLRGALLSDAG